MSEHIPEIAIQLIIALGSIIASSGFWTYWIDQKKQRNEEKDYRKETSKLLIGLAHHQIVGQCMFYLARGHISITEYESLTTHLYVPYLELGGNGLTGKLMEQLNELPHKPQGGVE